MRRLLTSLTIARGEPLVWGRRTYVMGIINVTPDSFSGDGLAGDLDAIVRRAVEFQGAGADFIDVGAESTRPGHQSLAADEELERLLPALTALAGKVEIPISVDTYKATVARRALEAGASMINDVWGLKADPYIARIAAESGAPLVLMHNQENTQYQDLLPDIFRSLSHSKQAALDAGVPEENIILDPGIGFGKTAEHNLEVLRRLDEFKSLGSPLLVGTSRKSTIGRVLDLPADQRLEGTAATVALAIAGGADIVRVHDVPEMVRVCRMSDAVVRGWRPDGWTK
ncbi:MAG: dihydropteroate synthase [SAR202 cluster bacterium Io17-Chloro-G2]|nr:MAG: dihydropteroate synthase [SAR202 cluster bacterium Io17-Chloro-G2]